MHSDNGQEPSQEYEENAQKSASGGWVAEMFEWVESCAMAIVFVVMLFTFAARTSVVNGTSMINTLHNKDMLVVSHLLYQPSRGDIVVITKPNSENEPLIKRIIALEGQTVDIDFSKGIVYVDGEALDEPYVNTPTNLRYDVKFPITVPKGDLFVLGDNRNGSLDSRSSRIGFIDTRYVLGKVYLRILPLGAFELFK
jgi:signal peptidase I